MSALLAIDRVAVVDDSDDDRITMAENLIEAGLEPVLLDPLSRELTDLVQEISASAGAAVCDHRLRGFTNYSGAEAVAGLFDARVPAILVSQYLGSDDDDSIRALRHKVPVMLSRDQANPQGIRQGIQECMLELSGQYSAARRPWRVMIEVERVIDGTEHKIVELRIGSWDPDELVRMPLQVIPKDIQASLRSGAVLIGLANIGAESQDDLYLDQLEFAPDPVPEVEIG